MNQPSTGKRRILGDPLIFGSLCGIASAFLYTAANACLRAVSDSNPSWVSLVKAGPTLFLFAPWLLVLINQGKPVMPSWRSIWMLFFSGLIAQLFGNVLFQWSLGIIGIALAVPLVLGSMILSGALLGKIVLSERVTSRSFISMGLLIVAIGVLWLGADSAFHSVQGDEDTRQSAWAMLAAVFAATICGLAYSQLGVVLRGCVTRDTALSSALVIVSIAGIIPLSLMAVYSIGWEGIANTPGDDFRTMLFAGFFNAVAFMALTKALQLTPVLYVNTINASQATMGALVGVFIFNEAVSPWLVLGVLLTIAGLLFTERRDTKAAVKLEVQEV